MLQYIPTLPIRVSNEDIYFYDDIYDEVKYISNPDIVFNNILFTTADKIINGERLSDTVEKIQNCEGCYVLTTNTKSQSVEKIMIYQMDGYYYFLNFYGVDDQAVQLIHYTNFKEGIEE